MDNYNELYEALLTIKSACEKYVKPDEFYDCTECPMSQNGHCCVTDLNPFNWKLNKPVCKIME